MQNITNDPNWKVRLIALACLVFGALNLFSADRGHQINGVLFGIAGVFFYVAWLVNQAYQRSKKAK